MRYTTLTTIATLSIAIAATGAKAQSDRTARFLDDCHDNGGRDEQVCETRDVTLPAGSSLTVDGGENGGITVHAWDRAETKVTALIEARAQTQQEAEAIAKQITIRTNASDVRAEGPGNTRRRESWSVSFEMCEPLARFIDAGNVSSRNPPQCQICSRELAEPLVPLPQEFGVYRSVNVIP